MSNYFEYQDFAKVDKNEISINSDSTLQANSNIDQLKKSVVPYKYASFEKGRYQTDSPLLLAPRTKKLGFVTSAISDENGDCEVKIIVNLNTTVSISGITLGLVNPIKTVNIKYLSVNGDVVRNETFNEGYYDLHFFNMASEGVSRVEITILKTLEPQRFIGVYRIDFGSLRIFDDKVLISAKVDSFYSVTGETIEYDVMKASIFHEADTEYLFLKRQPIIYKDEQGDTLNKFYVEKGESNTDNIITVTAYDSIALLEGNFLGGIYGFDNVYTGAEGVPYSFNQLLADIFSGTGVEYRTENTDDIKVAGYMPISTRRKALALLCRGTNVRCVKQGGVLVFKPVSSGNNVEYDDTVIVENPSIKTSQKVGKMIVKKHNYKKSNEEVELFNWYLQQGENTGQIVEFSEPVWKIRAYEITGVDEDGFDIVSETPSTNVIFANSPQDAGDETICNYAVLDRVSTSNKVLIKGWRISDNTESYTIKRLDLDVNAEYEEVTIEDITLSKCTTNSNGKITSLISEIAKFLFANANQRSKQDIEVLEIDRPQVGDNITTSLVNSPVTIKSDKGDITYNIKISSVIDDLSGVYRVVAE